MFFDKPYKPKGVDSRAVIGNDVRMGRDTTVYPFVYIDDGASIGDGVTIYPWSFIGQNTSVGEHSVIYSNVTIREGCKIGCRVIIHSGAVIGSDGFGFVPHQGKYHKIPQVGGVFVEDDVEIGANTTIDRGTIGSTIVRRGTKVDNLIQIAHNVSVGEDCILAAQSGIAGSTELGHHVTMAGQAGVTGHIRVGNHVTIAGQSGVTKDVTDGETVSGMPAFSHRDWLRAMAVFEGLPELKRKVNDLDKKLKNLLENK